MDGRITPRDIERFLSTLERIATALESQSTNGRLYQQYLDYVRENVEER